MMAGLNLFTTTPSCHFTSPLADCISSASPKPSRLHQDVHHYLQAPPSTSSKSSRLHIKMSTTTYRPPPLPTAGLNQEFNPANQQETLYKIFFSFIIVLLCSNLPLLKPNFFTKFTITSAFYYYEDHCQH